MNILTRVLINQWLYREPWLGYSCMPSRRFKSHFKDIPGEARFAKMSSWRKPWGLAFIRTDSFVAGPSAFWGTYEYVYHLWLYMVVPSMGIHAIPSMVLPSRYLSLSTPVWYRLPAIPWSIAPRRKECASTCRLWLVTVSCRMDEALNLAICVTAPRFLWPHVIHKVFDP